MIRVNNFDIQKCNNVKYMTAPTFKGAINNAETKMQTEEIPTTTPDFAVKTPIAYKKTEEIDLPYGLEAHCYKLANGQKIIIVPREGATVLKTYVKTGSLNETDDIRGISHFLEHNFFNGSDGLEKGEFFKTVDKMGAYTNAATGMAETNYFIKSNLLNDTDLEEQIKIHSSMLQSPKFAVDMLEKEKHIVNSEINMITSDPANLALNRMIKNLYGIETKSQDLIGGTTDNITALTRDDVVNYFNRNYYPANLTTIITGEVDPDETIKLISKYFNSKKEPPKDRFFVPLNPTDKSIREDIISEKAKGTIITVGFDGPKSDNIKDKIAAAALSLILGDMGSSRLNERLKEYNTSFEIADEKVNSANGAPRAMILAGQTTEENSEKVLKILWDEIEKIQNNPPTEDEMATVKKQLHSLFATIFEMSELTNNYLGEVLTESDFTEITEFEKNIDNLTSKDIQDAAKRFMDLNRASVVVMHPDTATKEKIFERYEAVKNISFGKAHTVIHEQNLQSFILPNNMNVITNDVTGGHANASIEIEKPVRLRNSKDLGAAYILNVMLNDGTLSKSRSEFTREAEQDGITIGFSADTYSIGLSANFMSEDTEKALSLMKEVFDNPRFTEKDFEQAKSKIKDTLSIAKKSAKETLYAELFKGQNKGITKKEVLASLDGITFDDVKDLYQEIITNSYATCTVSAPFKNDEKLKPLIFKKLNEYPNFKKFEYDRKNNFKPIETTKVLTIADASNQARVLEAFTFKTSGNLKDSLTINLMNAILGGSTSSRLFSDLRETRKLAYNVKSSLETVGNTGVIELSIGTTTDNTDTGEKSYDNVQKVIAGFNENIDRLINEKVTEEELNNVKLALKNNLLNSAESNIGKTSLIQGGLNSYYGITYVNQEFNMIDEITPEDIQNAARYVFAGKPTYSILATKNTLDYNSEFFKSLEN